MLFGNESHHRPHTAEIPSTMRLVTSIKVAHYRLPGNDLCRFLCRAMARRGPKNSCLKVAQRKPINFGQPSPG
jgi:hypothetical protein